MKRKKRQGRQRGIGRIFAVLAEMRLIEG